MRSGSRCSSSTVLTSPSWNSISCFLRSCSQKEIWAVSYTHLLYHIAGGYTGEESCEVMTILTSRELNELSDLVTEIDPKAFMTIARVNEARGRGFSIGKMEP